MKWLFSLVSSAIVGILASCQNNVNTDTPKVESTTEKQQQNTFHLISEKISKEDSIFYAQEGINLAKQMYFQILTRLNKALDEMGPYEAVKYCNHHALPLTDSLSTYYGIKAKRTSLKLRNPANAPDSLEKEVLKMYEQTLSKKPVVVKTSDGIKFFTPIYIANVCLRCHGTPNQDIPDVTIRALNELYPNDQAKNYELYDIRGMWSITFPNNYQSKLNTLKQ